jgi:ABC-type transporter Mla subunit MlaD
VSWYGDPDALDRLAVRLASDGERVRRCADLLRARPGQTRWRGPAAEAFAGSVRAEAAALDRAAGELDDAATALRAHAASVRHELARIRAAEAAVTGWLARQAARVEHAVVDLPSGAREWVDRLADLRRLGVPL